MPVEGQGEYALARPDPTGLSVCQTPNGREEKTSFEKGKGKQTESQAYRNDMSEASFRRISVGCATCLPAHMPSETLI